MSSGDINVNLSVNGTVQTKDVTPPQPGGVPAPPGGATSTPPPSTPQAPTAPKAPTPQPQTQAPGVPTGASSSTTASQTSGALSKISQNQSGTMNMSSLFQQMGGGVSQAASVASTAMGGLAAAGYALKLEFDILVGAARAVDDALTSIAQTARYYQSEVAAATALADVRSMISDIQQAQTLGPGLAQYVTARSELAASVKGLETTLVADILPLAIDMTQYLNDAVKGFSNLYETVSEGTGVKTWLPIVLGSWLKTNNPFGQVLTVLSLIASNTDPDKKDDKPSPTKDLENFANQVLDNFNKGLPILP